MDVKHAKRSVYAIGEKILWLVKEEPMTYAKLERKVNTGFRTIKLHCEALENLGLIDIDIIPEHPSNGRKSFKVHITDLGVKSLKRAKK